MGTSWFGLGVWLQDYLFYSGNKRIEWAKLNIKNHLIVRWIHVSGIMRSLCFIIMMTKIQTSLVGNKKRRINENTWNMHAPSFSQLCIVSAIKLKGMVQRNILTKISRISFFKSFWNIIFLAGCNPATTRLHSVASAASAFIWVLVT